MEIYILINEQPQGPYTPELIQQYLNSGELQSNQLAAYAGSADWQPLSQMVQSWAAAPAGKTPAYRPVAKPGVKPQRKQLVPILAGVLVLLAAAGGFAYWKLFGDSGPVVKVVTPVEPGIPNSLSELNAWYVEPPAGSNAATEFLAAFEVVATFVDAGVKESKDLPFVGKAPAPRLDKPLPKVQAAATDTLLRKLGTNYPVIGKSLARASNLDDCRYPLDFSLGREMPLPHLAKLKNFAEFSILQAVYEADRPLAAFKGQTPDIISLQASSAIPLALALGKSLEQEPITISQITRASCYALAQAGLEQVLNRRALTDRTLQILQNSFRDPTAKESDGLGFTRAVVGERAMSLAFMSQPKEKILEGLGRQNGGGAADGLAAKLATKNLASQRAFTEETFNQALQLRKQPFPDRLKVDDYFAARTKEAVTNRFVLAATLLPALGSAAKKEAACLVQLRLAEAAITLERFRLANGDKCPNSLGELTPKYLATAPQDPFDGQVLRYRKTATGYLLYSIGPDLQDDGGKRESGGKGDLVFEVIKAQKLSTQTGSTMQGAN